MLAASGVPATSMLTCRSDDNSNQLGAERQVAAHVRFSVRLSAGVITLEPQRCSSFVL